MSNINTPCLFRKFFLALSVPLLLTLVLTATSSQISAQASDLAAMSLEELMNIEIMSVSKKSERLADATAAVFVIRQQDIERSGATSIPEALRMVPGLQVARIDGSTWAISSRGFNGRFANKLLVLIDGRSVYTPSHSGVYWDMQDTLMEDIDRIEVIRGPGASLWGANAVNGVINIITMKAEETQGVSLNAGIGTQEKGFGSVRYGGSISEDAYYRVYAKTFDRDNSVDSFDQDMPDDWKITRGGFRMDWNQENSGTITLQGDIFTGDFGNRLTLPSLASPPLFFTTHDDNDGSSDGGNILARYQQTYDSGSEIILQTYYDRFERKEFTWEEDRDTFDIDFQHRFTLADDHEITWGLGYRYTSDDTRKTPYLDVSPAGASDSLFSAFLQDNYSLQDDKLALIAGTKIEHNDYTGFEFQPSLRMLWTPDKRSTVWAAVSRAVRTPSRVETDAQLYSTVIPSVPPFGLPGQVLVSGSSDYDSEELIAYEIGGRAMAGEKISLDVTAFVNSYDNLRTGEPGMVYPNAAFPPSYLIVPYTSDNKMSGKCYGIEVTADFRIQDWWNVQAAYTFLKMDLELDADSGDIISTLAEGENPENQFSIRSSMDLPGNVEFDVWLRYVDDLPAFNIDSYLEMDVRLAWEATDNVEISIVGQNLLDDSHQEFEAEVFIYPAAEVERSVYGKLALSF